MPSHSQLAVAVTGARRQRPDTSLVSWRLRIAPRRAPARVAVLPFLRNHHPIEPELNDRRSGRDRRALAHLALDLDALDLVARRHELGHAVHRRRAHLHPAELPEDRRHVVADRERREQAQDPGGLRRVLAFHQPKLPVHDRHGPRLHVLAVRRLGHFDGAERRVHLIPVPTHLRMARPVDQHLGRIDVARLHGVRHQRTPQRIEALARRCLDLLQRVARLHPCTDGRAQSPNRGHHLLFVQLDRDRHASVVTPSPAHGTARTTASRVDCSAEITVRQCWICTLSVSLLRCWSMTLWTRCPAPRSRTPSGMPRARSRAARRRPSWSPR